MKTKEATKAESIIIGCLMEGLNELEAMLAASSFNSYEEELASREELLKLRYKIKELIDYKDQSIILKMEEDNIKKSECELCFFEWHQRVKKTTWDKGRLISIVDDYHIPTKDIINLLYKNFQLSTNGLKEMGKAGETIIATCRLVEEGEGKTLSVRLKEIKK